MRPSASAFIASLMAEYGVGWARRQVRSTTDTSGVGTRNAIPVSFLENPTLGRVSELKDFSVHLPSPLLFPQEMPQGLRTSLVYLRCALYPGCSLLPSYPLSAGMTLPTALAAPVEAGMMFWWAPRPSLQAFFDGPSTVFWVAV